MLLAAVSCSTPEKHHRKGDVYYAHGEYYDAALEYKTAYSMTPRADKEARGQRAFLMGECYRRINSVSKAEGAYRNAVRYNYVDTTTYFRLAEVQRMQGNYKAARQNYELYLNLAPDDRLTLNGIESCDLAPQMKAAGSNYTVHPVNFLTSRRADYSPVLYGEKFDQLIFTSTRPQAMGDDESPITGMKNGDLFYTSKDEKGKWKQVEALEGSVNTAYDEGAATVSPDGNTMYLTVCTTDPEYPRYAEIHSSSRSDATWSKPAKVAISADTLSSFAHPAVSPDGKWLYFVSDMPGGVGGLDIWRVQLDDHGMGVMENLGEPVNTPGDEMFPTFRFNGDLYFSSNGHPGMGGLDLYCAHPDTVNNKWRVEILPAPMNSSGDDFGMTFEGIHNRGFFSSNRKNGRGWDHIYSFERPEVVQTVTGWVYEQDGYELPQATVYMIGNDGTNLKFGLRGDGSFEQVIKPGVQYVLLATCDGFLNYKQEIMVDSSEVSTCDTVYFPLPSVNSPVLVRNVFYEFNSAKLTDDSRKALDNLATLLNDNANITIELSSHCDYRGNELYNRKLSQHRAESVVDYLIEHGIDAARLSAVGYGKLRPKVVSKKLAESYKYLHEGDTLTEKFIKKLREGEQDTCNALNRRTEFRVLKTTYGLFDDSGNINANALLNKSAAQKKAKTEPVVKVYVPTPEEAAAADGKTVAEVKKNAEANKKALIAKARRDSIKAASASAKAKPAAAKAKNDTVKAKSDTVKAKTAETKHAAKNTKATAPETKAIAKETKATAPAAKATAADPKAKTIDAKAKATADSIKKVAVAESQAQKAGATQKKAATAAKDTAKTVTEAAKPAEPTAKKQETKPAAKETKADAKDNKAEAENTKPTAKETKTDAKDSKAKTSEKEAKASDKNTEKSGKSSKASSKASKTSARAAATAAQAAKTTVQEAVPAVKNTETAAKSAKSSSKTPKTSTKTSDAAKLKAKAEAKAQKDSLKLAKKKAKEAAKIAKQKEKAAAKAAKLKAAKEKADAKAAEKAAKAKAKTSAAAAKSTKAAATKTKAAATKAKATATAAKTAAKSATAKQTDTAAKAAKSAAASAAETKAAAPKSAKSSSSKLSLKEREALRDSIIARAKRDAEAEKAKKK